MQFRKVQPDPCFESQEVSVEKAHATQVFCIIGVLMASFAILQDGRLTVPYIILLVLGISILATSVARFVWRNLTYVSTAWRILVSGIIGALPLIGLLRIFAR